MENHRLVLPANLNHYGYLFGGDLLKWVDEFAWMSASLDYPGGRFVTVGMDKVEFRKSVREGTILKFVSAKTRVGRTSVQYCVTVFKTRTDAPDLDPIFSTHVTFVRVDINGNKQPMP